MVNFSGKVLEMYTICYNIDKDLLNRTWIPKVICKSCVTRLNRWHTSNSNKYFSSPASLREVEDHEEDCYYCVNDIKGLNSKNKSTFNPTITDSVVMPMRRMAFEIENMEVDECSRDGTEVKGEHNEGDSEFEVAEDVVEGGSIDDDVAYRSYESDSESETDESSDSDSGQDQEYREQRYPKTVRLFSQKSLNDLIRDIGLTKANGEVLTSRWQERGMLKKEVIVSLQRNRDKQFVPYFTQERSLIYCHDIDGLLQEFGVKHNPAKWRLFIDSSKRSLKGDLLNNGNELASIPIAHSTTLDECYNNMEYLLQKINYTTYQWKICTDLKVVTIVLGQHGGFTKNPCFLCLWYSRAREEHYVRKEWPLRTDYDVAGRNMIHKNLVDPSKILLPPLHIKLGLMKQYVKALKKRESDAFTYLFEKFPKLSDAKIKEGVFDGPQIRQLLGDPKFPEKMDHDEKNAWQSFVDVSQKVLGNFKDPNHNCNCSKLAASL